MAQAFKNANGSQNIPNAPLASLAAVALRSGNHLTAPPRAAERTLPRKSVPRHQCNTKQAPKQSKNNPKTFQNLRRDVYKTPPRRHKTHPRHAKMPQHAPKTAPRHSKTHICSHKSRTERQDIQKDANMEPSWHQHRPQNAPKMIQKSINNCLKIDAVLRSVLSSIFEGV